jgi:hypothetical protein
MSICFIVTFPVSRLVSYPFLTSLDTVGIFSTADADDAIGASLFAFA